MSSTGYTFETREQPFLHAEAIPEGPSVQQWIDFARAHTVYLAAGLVEQAGMKLFDSAVLVGPEGFVGVYRKA